MNEQTERMSGLKAVAWRVVAAAAVGATLAMAACNTVSGVGQDLQEASDNVKDAIEN